MSKAKVNKLTTKRFVIRKSLIGTNTVITFTNKEGKTWTYNHDEVFNENKERFENYIGWDKYGNYTQTHNVPKFCRNLKSVKLELPTEVEAK